MSYLRYRAAPPLLLAGTALGLCLATPAPAQTIAPQSTSAPTAPPDGNVHPEDSPTTIVVLGRLLAGERDPIVAPVVLTGDTLLRNLQPQIGAMLEHLPGVSASGFAPGVSRPILRGLEGARVQVLIDGLGSLDASSVSNDHAVSIDTLNVERIDVLHGPQALLYSSDPAGGVVNALDTRIPRRVPTNAIEVQGLASYGTAANAADTAASANVRLAPRLVGHVDGSYSHSGDLSVGGLVVSPGLRATLLTQAEALRDDGDTAGADSLTTQANARGKLQNSQTESWSYGGGLAFIDGGGTIGVSVSRHATDYGIPPRPGVGDGEGPVSIGLRQTRADLRAAVDLDGFLRRIEVRGAYGDYHHTEFDGDVAGTRFANTAIDTRLEAIQARRGIWSGSSGLQYADLDLSVVGDEKLIPNNETDRLAAFTLQRLEFGNFDIELAGRYERTAIVTKPQSEEFGSAQGRDFDQWSGVAGLAWHPSQVLSFSLDVSRGERAPAAEELYINGFHDATQSYEIGNPTFVTERSRAIEAGVHVKTARVLLALTAYATNYSGFITPVPTGDEIDGAPVYQFIQADARFRGFEAEGSTTLAQWGERSLKLDAAGDYTHASLVGIGPVPLIPPLRVRGGLEYGDSAITLRGEVEWNDHQRRVTENEYPVSAFTLVNASAIWHPGGTGSPLTLILSGDNLLDVSGRRAVSETRDFVPIAGRDIKLTARFAL